MTDFGFLCSFLPPRCHLFFPTERRGVILGVGVCIEKCVLHWSETSAGQLFFRFALFSSGM
jgi:hypothetical protein